MRVVDMVTTTEARAWSREQSPAGAAALPVELELGSGTDQVIEGFGGCFNELGQVALATLPAAARDEILDLLFAPGADGLRLTTGRLPIGASDYATSWYSHDERPGDLAMESFSIERDHELLIPYLRAARQRQPDLRLVASPWSPPTWLKHPPVHNHGTLVWRPEILDAYALYLARFTEEYAAIGLPVAQVHVQNEPVSDQKFPSCVWTADQFRDFIRGHLGPLFQRRGVASEIWVGTINEDPVGTAATAWNDHPFVCLTDPACARYVAGVAYQWAGRAAIAALHAAFPAVRLAQSENECGDGRNTWDHARYVNELFRHYLGNGAGTYLYWNMVLPEGGHSTWGWPQNCLITVDPGGAGWRIRPEFWVMKHYSSFVGPGARRRRLAGPWSARSVAFTDPAGRTVVVTGNPLRRPVELRLAGESIPLPADSITTVVLA